MKHTIEKKIVSWGVKDGEKQEVAPEPEVAGQTWEPHTRPRAVRGVTYKIKIPTAEHALYVTINDIELEDGRHRPIEIFINSKNMDSFQWIVALTKLVSAIFRQPGDYLFMIEELKGVFDPRGGHFLPGGQGLCPSIVAHIGLLIEEHCRDLGLIDKPALDEHQQRHVDAKREEAEAKGVSGTECPKCKAMAMVRLDNCDTCLECGHSKCG